MDDIPFSCMSHQTWLKLANKLDIRCSITGNDWRMLAEELGYSTEEIMILEEKRSADGRNTMKLFEEYVKRDDSMVGAVKAALEKMKRDDALKILEEDMPHIQERYQKQMQSKHHQPVENEYWSRAHMHTHTHTPNHLCYTPPSLHFMCPGSAGSHGENYHPYLPPQSYPMMAPLSPCCGNLRGVPGCMPPCLPGSCGPRSNCRGSPNCSGVGDGRGLCGGGDSRYPPGMQARASPAPHPHHAAHSQQMDCSPYPSLRYRGHSEAESSMTVHTDGDHLEQPADAMDTDDVEMYNRNKKVEQPASLPRAILRGQASASCNGTKAVPMKHCPDMDLTREEMSTSHKMADKGRQCQQFARQVSEECNAKQPLYPPQGPRTDDHLCPVPKKRLNIHCSGSREDPVAARGPLEKLQSLANHPEKYMPNDEYKTVVADQKIDDTQLAKGGVVKQEQEDISLCQHAENQDSIDRPEFHSSENLWGRGAGNCSATNPKTFPLRLRTHPAGVTMEELHNRDSVSSPLTKSLSMPIDMKVAVFRKAFRNIKLFVTYSIDSKKHLQKILSLCNCIEKNGFTCSVDIYGQKGREMNMAQRMHWFEKKFYEADFILVCISPKYKADVDRNEAVRGEYLQEEESSQQQSLHTCHIYRMMISEFQNNNHHNHRFIPLIFDGASKEHVPTWLLGSLAYLWPAQYKDLLWRLSKPEERIKPKSQPYQHDLQPLHLNRLSRNGGNYPTSPQHPHNNNG